MSTSVLAAEFSALRQAMDQACADLLAGVESIFGASNVPAARKEAVQASFWELKGGLRLRGAWYDPSAEEFVVEFAAGPVFRVPRARLAHEGVVFAVDVDEFGHGVGVAFADGASTDFSSDWVLYESSDDYRSAHAERGPPVSFGARIRELRTSKGLKAVEVAKACGMAPSNFARLEADAHLPSMETLARVSAALAVPLAALVSRR